MTFNGMAPLQFTKVIGGFLRNNEIMKLNNEKGLAECFTADHDMWIRMQVFGGVAQRMTQTFSIRGRICFKVGE